MSALSKQPLWCRKLSSVLPFFNPRKDSLWSSLGFVSNLKLLALLPSCPLKHERGGKQERRSEEAGLKEMKVVCFLKTHFCRWVAVDFRRMATVGTPNIAESHLRPVIWAIICSLLFREYSSSGGGFCLNSVMFLQSKSKDHFYVKTLWKTWKHHLHLQRAQSELLGDFQDRRCYLVTGEWEVEFIFLEKRMNIESKTIATIRAQVSQS